MMGERENTQKGVSSPWGKKQEAEGKKKRRDDEWVDESAGEGGGKRPGTVGESDDAMREVR